MSRGPWPIGALGALLGLGAIGCSSNHLDPQPPPPPSTAAAPLVSVTAASSAMPRAPSPRESDPRWLLARDADPAERARLAVEVGAAGLLEGVEDGGEIEATALAALPFADDAEIALGRLAEITLEVGPTRRRSLLGAILAVAGQPRRQRDPLDPEGVRRCGQILLRLAATADLARPDRVLAVSAARALAEKGYVDPAKIPGDLDPK